ncbi:MAG: DinB family protein [bacterium]|nr:DinB family protein [bacterium]
MDLAAILPRLAAFPRAVRALYAPATEADLRWKPPAGGWSLLEILCHLADEEVEDFRTRIRLTLEDPAREWPSIDPEGDIERRKYNEQDPAETLGRLEAARTETVTWLSELASPDWTVQHESKLGELRAGDVLASLVAHDALHLRQIARRMYDLSVRDCEGFSTDYAGGW